MTLTFDRDFPLSPAHPQQVSPRICRVLAPNAGPFTFTGTVSYLIGTTDLAVIDPGPDSPSHIEALLAAIGSRRLTHIVVTHTHKDHAPAARHLAQHTRAKIVGCVPMPRPTAERPHPLEASTDWDYTPDHTLSEGDTVSGPDWTLETIVTPGHTSNHLCFALSQERVIFTGDHVMGWSTSMVAPPEGNMADYMASLRKLLHRAEDIYYPAHGREILNARRFTAASLHHRHMRENTLMGLLDKTQQTLDQLVGALYPQLEQHLIPAARLTTLAHLEKLQGEGRISEQDGVYLRVT